MIAISKVRVYDQATVLSIRYFMQCLKLVRFFSNEFLSKLEEEETLLKNI